MRISEAARRLGTSARMLRYREELGLLPQVRDPLAGLSGRAPAPERAAGAAGAAGRSAEAAGRSAEAGAVVSAAVSGRAAEAGAVVSGRAAVAGGVAGGVTGGVTGGRLGQAGAGRGHGATHRQFGEADLEAVAAALELERRYDISPASLAFGLRVLAEPPVRAAVADLGRRLGRIAPAPGRALDFEKERALRLLSRR